MSHDDRSAMLKKLKKAKKAPPVRKMDAVTRDRPYAVPARQDEPDVPPAPGSQGRIAPRRPRLVDVLSNTARRDLASAWGKTDPAGDFVVLPAAEYTAHIIQGTLHTSKKRTPGYKLTFEVVEGEFAGRKIWHDIWLTPAAVPMAKRDLAKLGVPVDDFDTMRAHLEKPLPEGIRCEVRLTVRTDDDGHQSNRVQRFVVVGIDGPDRDAFAPEKEDGERKPTGKVNSNEEEDNEEEEYEETEEEEEDEDDE